MQRLLEAFQKLCVAWLPANLARARWQRRRARLEDKPLPPRIIGGETA